MIKHIPFTAILICLLALTSHSQNIDQSAQMI